MLKNDWEPCENEVWFTNNVICGTKRSHKKFRLLYEWVEDEVNANDSIRVDEVRYQAGVLIGEQFGKYEKFEKLGERKRKFLKLRAVGESGKAKKWISAE